MRFTIASTAEFTFNQTGKSWSWVARGMDGTFMGSGDADSVEAARKELREWFQAFFGFALEGLCQCGGTKIGMKAHEPGHSHWCPVTPYNCVVEQ